MKKNAQSVEAWLEAMIAVARYYRLDFSQENVRATVNWERDSKREELLTDMARQLGMGLRLVEFSADSLNPWRLPLIAVFDNQQIGVITRRDNHDNISVQFSGDEGLETTLNVADIEDKIVELALLRPLSAIPDARVDDYIRPYQANWFWSLSLKDWRRYGDIMLASLVANVLALAAMIFSMQVYDRVVPAQSYPTLWVLFAGVMMAILFEFCMRMVRTHLSDVIGKAGRPAYFGSRFWSCATAEKQRAIEIHRIVYLADPRTGISAGAYYVHHHRRGGGPAILPAVCLYFVDDRRLAGAGGFAGAAVAGDPRPAGATPAGAAGERRNARVSGTQRYAGGSRAVD